MATKDIDLSEFKGDARGKRVCLVGEFIETLSEEDQLKVNAALEDRQYKTTNIHRWIMRKTGGENLRLNTVTRHRLKDCSCYKN